MLVGVATAVLLFAHTMLASKDYCNIATAFH
jgi:hypothetical protein